MNLNLLRRPPTSAEQTRCRLLLQGRAANSSLEASLPANSTKQMQSNLLSIGRTVSMRTLIAKAF
jgi:hypothetical protein